MAACRTWAQARSGIGLLRDGAAAPLRVKSGVSRPGRDGKIIAGQRAIPAAAEGRAEVRQRMHFIAESNTCKLVEGKISPEGWCIIWASAA
jgi:hypothetical protein